MSPELGARIVLALGLAAAIAACSGGSGKIPDIEANPQDPALSTFEAPGNSAMDSHSCVPCDQRYRCTGQVGDKYFSEQSVTFGCDATVAIPSVTVTTPAEPADQGGSSDQTTPIDGGLQTRQSNSQSTVSSSFRCGGAIEVQGRRIGSWSTSPEGVLTVCSSTFGSGNCIVCYPSAAATSSQEDQTSAPSSSGGTTTNKPVPSTLDAGSQ